METNLVIDRATFKQLAVLMAMQGLLANSGYDYFKIDAIETGHLAVTFADALTEAMTVDEIEPRR